MNLMALGYILQNRLVLVIAGLVFVATMVTSMDGIFDLLFQGNWLLLGAMGVATIVIASLVERHGAVIKHQFGKMRRG